MFLVAFGIFSTQKIKKNIQLNREETLVKNEAVENSNLIKILNTTPNFTIYESKDAPCG